jgi:uncharacterized protein YcbK (DUF882 family)
MGALGWTLSAALAASVTGASVTTPVATEPRAEHTLGLAAKKAMPAQAEEKPATVLLGTLVDIHTGEHLAFDEQSPGQTEIDQLLADRVTGAQGDLDPRLFELLRSLAKLHEGARIELVSGYRSPKLNEMLRKKGHHVASHSQHSLGHAVDFRIVLPEWPSGAIGPPAEREPMDPLLIEQEIRRLGWEGGTGTYLGATDRFVHADVGPNRRWKGL